MKRTRCRRGPACAASAGTPSAVTRLAALAVFAGWSTSVSVSVNGRSPRSWYGAGTLPLDLAVRRRAYAVSTTTPSIATLTCSPGVKPVPCTVTVSRVSRVDER